MAIAAAMLPAETRLSTRGVCALVAAHLAGLKAATTRDYQTIHVERPQEERHCTDEVVRAKQEGWMCGFPDYPNSYIIEAGQF